MLEKQNVGMNESALQGSSLERVPPSCSLPDEQGKSDLLLLPSTIISFG